MDDARTDDDARDRAALRGAMPRPTADAADALLAALHRNRLAAELFGEASDVTVDRYVLRRELGRGGMGVVFVAHDPLLDVPVALKLLRVGWAAIGDAESQLQREAHALARVRGDHVVRVYTAGFHMGQPWLAMQLVDGPHLGEWLRYRSASAGRTDWREVLARYVEAGRGLQAIHAAGLVHRDFKPQNAVVDADGCVKVLDFGLAAAAGPHSGPAVGEAPRLGTHRYAAPEQFLGRAPDPRSDQFSFCVALFEALSGALPLGEATSLGERLAADPTLKIPRPSTELPGWLVAALLRGLAARPEDRHPGMPALLHELTRDRRRGLRVAGLIGASFLAGALVFAVSSSRPEHDDRCEQPASDRWEEQRASLGLPASEVDRIDRAVTSYRQRWQHSRAALCDSRPRPADAVLAARHACLAREQGTFRAVLARAVQRPARLASAIDDLPAPETCLDLGSGQRAPGDPQAARLVDEAETQLALSAAARLYGAYDEASFHAVQAQDRAARSGHTPTAARVALALGVIAREAGDHRAAEDALSQALGHANLTHDPALQIEVLHERVRLDLLAYHDARDGQRDLDAAGALLPALGPGAGDRGTMLAAEHADMRGLLAFTTLQLADAIAAHSQAIAGWQQLAARPDAQRRLYEALLHRAEAHAAVPDPRHASADALAALRVASELHGPEHPALAPIYRCLAHAQPGDLPAAKAAMLRALALHHGHDAADEAAILRELAELSRNEGDVDGAEAYARKAAALADTDLDERAANEYLLAMLAVQKDSPDADARLQHALNALQGVPGPHAACDRAVLWLTRGLRGERHARLGLADDSLASGEQQLAEAGPDCSARSLAPWLRARLAVAREQPDEAERAFTAAIEHASDQRASQQIELAQLLCRVDCSTARVRALAAAAEPTLRQQGHADAAALAAALQREVIAGPRP